MSLVVDLVNETDIVQVLHYLYNLWNKTVALYGSTD